MRSRAGRFWAGLRIWAEGLSHLRELGDCGKSVGVALGKGFEDILCGSIGSLLIFSFSFSLLSP